MRTHRDRFAPQVRTLWAQAGQLQDNLLWRRLPPWGQLGKEAPPARPGAAGAAVPPLWASAGRRGYPMSGLTRPLAATIAVDPYRRAGEAPFGPCAGPRKPGWERSRWREPPGWTMGSRAKRAGDPTFAGNTAHEGALGREVVRFGGGWFDRNRRGADNRSYDACGTYQFDAGGNPEPEWGPSTSLSPAV